MNRGIKRRNSIISTWAKNKSERQTVGGSDGITMWKGERNQFFSNFQVEINWSAKERVFHVQWILEWKSIRTGNSISNNENCNWRHDDRKGIKWRKRTSKKHSTICWFNAHTNRTTNESDCIDRAHRLTECSSTEEKKENHPPLMYNCRSKHTVKTHLYTRRHERGSKRKRIESRIKFFVRFKFAVIVCVRFV